MKKFKSELEENVFDGYLQDLKLQRCRRGCDHMVVGFTTTYAISAYHH